MKKHALMTSVTIAGWLFFYLAGFQFEYVVSTPASYKVLLLLITKFSILPMFTFFLLSFFEGDFLRNSLWFSLYASFGIFFLDFLFVGIVHKHGLTFLKTHWLQTVGYIEALVVIPATGIALKKFISRKAPT